MKNFLLLALMILFPCLIYAQNNVYIINESFNETSLPSGWTTMDNGLYNWYISQSNICGGKPNEAHLSWTPYFNGISRLVTTPVDLTDITTAVLALKHYPSFFGTNQAIVGVATSSDNGTTWNTVWSEQYNTNEAYNILETISSPDMGKNNVLFCIYFEGTSSAISDWYFDDFEIYTIEDISVELTSIDVPSYIVYGNHDISFTIYNSGNTAIQTFKAKYTIDEEMIEQTFYTNLPSMESQQFTFDTDFDFEANKTYELSVEITSVNDSNDDESNNVLTKNINTALSQTQRTPMIEHFSSSTCGPCVAVNTAMKALTTNHQGEYTYTKYTTNGPGIGDPYFTEEGGARMTYYNVLGVPQLFLDGADQGYSAITEDNFTNSYNDLAFAQVRGAFDIEGNTINVSADFMSYVNMENVRAFVTVNEKTTTGNVATNGETEFHHVMMKMLENAEGNVMNINAGEYQRLEFSFDMSSTNVEDMNDLEVALWLQDYETKEIFNSHYAYEYTNHCYPVQNMKASIEGDCITLHISWDAPEQGTPTGYNIYIDGQLIEEKYQHTSYDNEADIISLVDDGETHIAEVVALYEDGMTSVGVTCIIDNDWINVKENNELSFNVYPNPAKDIVKISANNNQISTVRVYNTIGMMIDEIEVNSNEVEINVSDYNPGVYFFNVDGKTYKIIRNEELRI
ncbi:MAG: T9SS type A sorting domain-containing protein [Bacteroidales bacterium]|nr:T9SS type A sorting domain-containing protein [Bacteroidales bacterium]